MLVVVAVVGAVVGDVVARRQAQAALVRAVAKNVPGASGVSASISSFPFLGHLLVQGRVSEVDVRISQVAAGLGTQSVVELSGVDVDAHDVQLDKAEALRGRARVVGIGRGQARASISQGALQRLLPAGMSVRLAAGVAEVTGSSAGPAQVAAAAGGGLALRLARPAVTIPIALPTTVLPCPPQATIADGAVTLSCTFTGVPRLLLDRVQG